MTGRRCDCNVCLAGVLGSHVAGSTLRLEDRGVFVSISCCRAALLASRSMILFCNLTTDVHFFSRRPSYFFAVASSKFGPRFDSSLRQAALFDRPTEARYATMDLCLESVRNNFFHGRFKSNYSSSACLFVSSWLIISFLFQISFCCLSQNHLVLRQHR